MSEVRVIIIIIIIIIIIGNNRPILHDFFLNFSSSVVRHNASWKS